MNYGYLSYVGDDERDGLTSSQRRLIKRAGGPRRPVSRSYAGQVVDRLIYQELIAPGKTMTPIILHTEVVHWPIGQCR